MTNREILGYIDRGANFYVSLFGRAEHMERVKGEFYSFVRPKGDVYGISFAYDVRLNGLPREEMGERAREIKALGMPVWVDLTAPGEVRALFFGDPEPEPDPEGESYLFMLPEDVPESCPAKEVRTADEFARWAGVVNGVLSGGKEDLHPRYHYPLCRDGLLRCYMALDGAGRAVSTAAAAVDGDAVTLEFVATLPEHRRRGLAGALCKRAAADAFSGGARIVTVRAIDGTAARLYEAVGFRRCGL